LSSTAPLAVPELLRTKLLPELEKTNKLYTLEYKRVYPATMSMEPHRLKETVEVCILFV
jgi:hypothetical protein